MHEVGERRGWRERPSARVTVQNGRHPRIQHWGARAPADLHGQRSEGMYHIPVEGRSSSLRRATQERAKSSACSGTHLQLPQAAKMTNSWQEAPLTPLYPPLRQYGLVLARLGAPYRQSPSARRRRIGARRRGAGPEPGARGRCSINTGPLRRPLRSLRVAIPSRAAANLRLRASQLPASPPHRVLRVASSHRRRHERTAQRLPRGFH